MSELKHIGKLGNIQGKPKVYFSCHPRDFAPYFQELSQEILRIVNCAIFYYEPDADVSLDDDYYLDLSQMQLFVIPVTGHLLRERSRAMDVELRFAMERHIPVLPIMLENGLTETFGQRFGNLQFLNRISQDDSELPYEEKLSGRLRSVLVGDELAEKIRAAFDACIFLSYRKKDRVYAQQLMRLIHKNEFCRDIAIWYDEFLSPGEDFNNAIADALKKSDLFALAITPNVVNEVNYIMTTEYPMARQENKPILPVELVPTDREMLREKYEGCPDCTNAYDGRALSAAIAAKLRDFALRENDGDPRHNFLIGLAYLNGIDVELDRDRALELITGAAEAGLIDALQKIRDMYLYGEHVSPSYSMAAHWTRALAARLEEQYREEPTEANGSLLTKAFWDLGDYLDESGKRKEAELAYEKMQSIGKALVLQWNSTETRRMLAVSLTKLGTAARDRGDMAKARDLIQQGLEYFQQLYDILGTPRAAWDLAVTSGRMGSLLSREDPQAALDRFLLAVRLLREADSGAVSDRVKLRIARNRAVMCNAIGDLYYSTGRPNEAIEYVRQSIRITDQIRSEEHGDLSINSLRDLAQSHAIAGNIFFTEKQWDAAEDHYRKSAEIDRWLYDEFHAYQDVGALHACYSRLEQIYMAKRDWDRAGNTCRSRLTLIPELWPRESPEGKAILVNAYIRLGEIYLEAGCFRDSLQQFLSALEHNRQLYQMAGTEEAADGITALFSNIGYVYALAKQDDMAEDYYRRGLEQAKFVYETFRTAEAGLTLAGCHYTLGRLYRRTGRRGPALDQYEAGLDLCGRMYHDTRDPAILRSMTGAFQDMGDIHREAGLAEDAIACYDWAATGATTLWRQSGSPADLDSAAVACYCLGTVSQGSVRETSLKNAADYWTALSQQYPDRPDYAAKARQALRLLGQ